VTTALLLALIASAFASPADVEAADNLYELGIEAHARAEHATALEHFEASLQILENLPESDPFEVGRVVMGLAIVHRARADYGAARRYAERALAIAEGAFGAEHHNVAQSLSFVAVVAKDEGDLIGARKLYNQALNMQRKLLGPSHTHVAGTLNNLAILLVELGDYDGARDHYTEALEIALDAFGPDDPEIASYLNNLAILLETLGEYAEARVLLERALQLRIAAHGERHPLVANSQTNLAILAKAQGDTERARELFEQALESRRATLPPDHPDIGASLANLGNLAWRQRDLERARTLIIESLDIFGDSHIDTADVQCNLAGVLVDMEQLDEAMALYESCLTTQRAVRGDNHADVAITLSSIADVHSGRGDLASAMELHDQAIAMLEEAVGSDHPDLAGALGRRAKDHASADNIEFAKRDIASALSIWRRRMASIDLLTEREALAYMSRSRGTLDTWLAFHRDDSNVEQAWAETLYWKGAATRRLGQRGHAQRDDPASQALVTDLRETRLMLARRAYSSEGDSDDDAVLDDLRTRKEEIERELARQGGSWAREEASRSAGPAQICERLAAGSVLIDIVRYDEQYVAFVVSNTCAPVRVELGEAKPIEERVEHWRALLADDGGMIRVDREGAEVRDLIWTPIAPHVQNAETLLVIPDAALAAVPFAALPLDDGTYLIERWRVTYLNTAHDLLGKQEASEASGALVLGGVDFGDPSEETTGFCIDRSFPPLPGTAREVAEIQRLWSKGAHRRESMRVLVGRDATEHAVERGLEGRRVVHLATHGFFAGVRCPSALSSGDGTSLDKVVGYNPMLLSGVVLAGVNEADSTDVHDGILTAEEVATLDLRQTDLVVLSACETGLGDIQDGEGVLGLQRGFSLAGARTTVMSMWAVPDELTVRLMGDFYRRFLHRRRPVSAATAMHEAQLEMLRYQRQMLGSGAPGSWAAFVVAGAPNADRERN